MTLRDEDRLNELIRDCHAANDELLQIATKAKQFYKEAELDYYKELFKKLNDVSCEAGALIAQTGADISGQQIHLYLKVLQSLVD